MGHQHNKSHIDFGKLRTTQVCLFVCGGSLTSGQLVKGSFQTEPLKDYGV